jgi:hypothetical protein
MEDPNFGDLDPIIKSVNRLYDLVYYSAMVIYANFMIMCLLVVHHVAELKTSRYPFIIAVFFLNALNGINMAVIHFYSKRPEYPRGFITSMFRSHTFITSLYIITIGLVICTMLYDATFG